MENTTTLPVGTPLVGVPHQAVHEKLSRSPGRIAMLIFGLAIVGGMVFTGIRLGSDLAQTHYPTVWRMCYWGLRC
jgi:hypothetical protein